MTVEEEAQLWKSIADLETKVDGLAHDPDTFKGLGQAELLQNCRTRYQENGNWARHYSTVRMTVTTFLIPVSLGVLAFKWTPPTHPPINFLALSDVVWMAAVFLFVLFTRLTYEEMERARRRRMQLREGVATGEGSSFHPCQDHASYVLAFLTIAYGVLSMRLGDLRWWLFVSFAKLVRAFACVRHAGLCDRAGCNRAFVYSCSAEAGLRRQVFPSSDR
ncbi:MAG: hypothetical protein ACR2HH_07060 [Chthoniobacterales bacterium]